MSPTHASCRSMLSPIPRSRAVWAMVVFGAVAKRMASALNSGVYFQRGRFEVVSGMFGSRVKMPKPSYTNCPGL